MRFNVQTAEMTRALYMVQGIASKKTDLATSSHVLLDANEKQLVVSATDLDVGLSGTYEAIVEETGAIAVHAKQLYDIIKSLPTETAEIVTTKNNWLEISAGQSRFRLVGMQAEEFPELPNHQEIKLFKMPAPGLLEMIDRTLFCVSTDENRHNLGGIYCESLDANTLRMVSTDGHRLALAEHTFDSDVTLEQGVIVPRKGVQEIKRVLGDTRRAGVVEIGFSSGVCVLKAGSVVLSTRLIEGRFPDYNQVIPSDSDKTATVGRALLSEALKRVSLLSNGKDRSVYMDIKEGVMAMTAEDPGAGSASESVPIVYSGDPVTIGFNAGYVLDAISAIPDGGDVVLTLSDGLSPGVLRSKGGKGNFLSVVMPVRATDQQ